MTHIYNHHVAPPVRSKAERIRDWSIGGVLAVAGTLSLIQLVGAYQASGPWRAEVAARRAEEAAAYKQEQAEREAAEERARAEADLRGENGRDAELRALGDVARSDAPATDPSASPEAEARRLADALNAERARARAAAAAPSTGPLRWRVAPRWPQVRDSAFPEGETRISVDFRCRVSREGVLTSCVSNETPRGSGLAERMRPALADARLEPMLVNGRAVESTASFGVYFTATRRQAPPPAAARPAPDDEPPVFTPPPPEPVPAG